MFGEIAHALEQARGAGFETSRGKHLLQVLVRDNNVDQALKVLKRKMQREGVFREMKRRRFYEKTIRENGPRKKRSNPPSA
jgi:ribosomal protein S21